MESQKTISLKHLIALLALAAMLITLANSLYAGYRMSKEDLMENTKEMNRVYAVKLASITNYFLAESQYILQYKGRHIASYMGDAVRMKEEAADLLLGTHRFNAVMITDLKGNPIASYPENGTDIGKLLTPVILKEALASKGSYVSEPYTVLANQQTLCLASQIQDEEGHMIGLVMGFIYLNEENELSTVLGEHFYQDGSYVYIVDRSGRILYHQDPSRVFDNVMVNGAVQKVLAGERGALRVTNTRGVDMLAGYAPIPITGWGIIAQRPTEAALAPASAMAADIMKKALPLFILTILLAVWIAKGIAKPLHQLSNMAQEASTKNSVHHSEISAWYYEARELKKALMSSLTQLQHQVDDLSKEASTDPLTGLNNRRTLEEFLEEWERLRKPLSVILIDVDHFKKVNDTYGHAVGDQVLCFLAEKIRQNARVGDLCCRFGGEEFVVVIPGAGVDQAYQAAERLRKVLEGENSPTGQPITISLGIARFPHDSDDMVQVLELADQCLYQAKQRGRNQTVMWQRDLQEI